MLDTERRDMRVMNQIAVHTRLSNHLDHERRVPFGLRKHDERWRSRI
jgi:hypothetical protein